ncbi:hypothetical protein HBA54_07555 [Pelagibius litoralis]|uniref:Restriction endonuclease n=1 Tax=Pelagibius litoralis TaxID=374515 RepID=A0A967C210_9PROT|nr:hypothetical protein [Pelagibius litoralis]NIA68446.1 hypothetical protein [Pelagibius litoralis]
MTNDNSWDYLSADEAECSQAFMEELSSQSWAAGLVADIKRNGGITRKNKGRLFELRFAYSLHRVGIQPSYEIPGEGKSTLDFGFTSGDQEWAVELMRLEETAAIKESTRKFQQGSDVAISSLLLHTGASDPRQSPEAETLKAIERICQKCERDDRPIKFPRPSGALHTILVDSRELFFGPDHYDCIHIALGGEYVPENVRHFWQGNVISGVFNKRTSLHGARYAQERVHFIGFVNEQSYQFEEFGKVIRLVANPNLFADDEAARAAVAKWPLQSVDLL